MPKLPPQLMNKAKRDRAADGPEQLTVGEIVRLYRAAYGSRNDLHPLLLLMGLFTAQGQSELASVRREELDLDAAAFTHRRDETGQMGVYWLPPELVSMLRAYFGDNPAARDQLAFRTREGQPLVTDTGDAVRQAWDDWRVRAGLDRSGVGFYALRRFFGDYATRAGGDAVGAAALAHTAKSVRGKHCSGHRDFSAVRQVGQQLHAELPAAGMLTSGPPTNGQTRPNSRTSA